MLSIYITGEQLPGAQTAALNASKVILHGPVLDFPVGVSFVASGQYGSFKSDTSWPLALVAILGASKVILRGPHP